MNTLQLIDNSIVTKDAENYVKITIDTDLALKSWRLSLMSFEWIDKTGKIKPIQDLPEAEQEKRAKVEEQIKNGRPIEKPILGIGLQDNIEIGAGRAEFLTLVANGFQHIPVHIRKSHQSDFKPFLADISS